MNDLRWWADQARDVHRHQLEIVRKQAEAWRAGLSGLTALIGTVLLVKGRDSFADLETGYAVTVAVLLGLTAALLVTATLKAISAASGVPGDNTVVTPESLRRWSMEEAFLAQRRLLWARRLTVGGFCLLAMAVGLTWFAPEAAEPPPLLQVVAPGEKGCGMLVGMGAETVMLRSGDDLRILSLTEQTRLTTVTTCPDG
ncbi:hypothetical protein [Kineosporia babensis]|uniref:Uncharacterized protein n=1 Tax=Kineosporia babensis TaxID=499548 RepID=A0A9X1SWK5_9ACTN|nr:hypothetical protein [Kineosporia babensis]MCD5314844.1 hypothetical protein [Kineosporia babensis]